MSATITTGKLASAFRSQTGEVIYCLYEETYEKNVFPHTPRWSCINIGGLRDSLALIFGKAASCESGGLQGRGGDITPEGYIAAWLKLLASPGAQDDTAIELKVSKGWFSVLTEEKLPIAGAVLTSLGRDDAFSALKDGGSVVLSLHSDVDIVLALMESGAEIYPWRLIRDTNGARSLPRPDLGYRPEPSKRFDVHSPVVLKLNDYERVIGQSNGTFALGGWDYELVGDFIRELWEQELVAPGSYRKRIKAFRLGVQAAGLLPAGMKLAVDCTSIPADHWAQSDLTALAGSTFASKTDIGFEMVFPIPDHHAKQICHLPRGCMVFMPPHATSVPSAAPAQLSLI